MDDGLEEEERAMEEAIEMNKRLKVGGGGG